MTLTRPLIRQTMFGRIEGLGGYRTATEREADGLIDPMMFKVSNGGKHRYKGAIIYSPNGSESELIREAGSVNVNKLFQTGDPWTMTDLYYELYYIMHPFDVNQKIKEALHELYGEVMVPVTLWPDGDLGLDLTDVSKWNNGTITAPTKSAAYKSISNAHSLIVTTAGGNFYAQSEDVAVDPGESLFHAAIGSLDMDSSGECYYALWDRTNNRAIYSTTFTSYRPQIIRHQDVIPAGCHKVAIRVGSTANGVTTIWKGFPSHFIGSKSTPVQSWLKEQRNLLGLHKAYYPMATGQDRFAADNRETEAMTDAYYTLLPFVPASDVYYLQITQLGGMEAVDYWIHGYRKMNEIEEELDNDLAETNFDNEDMLLTAVETLICEFLGEDYADQAARGRALLDAQRISKRVVNPKPETGIQHIGMRCR